MVVAFILGLSATIIAIWYGRKSFELTKQSFEALVKQIESSEKVSLMVNERIFEQQKQLQRDKQEISERDKRLFDIRNNLALYIRNYNLLKKDLITANSKFGKFESIQDIKANSILLLEKLEQRKEDLILNIAHFETFFEHTEPHLLTLKKGYEVLISVAQIINDFLEDEKKVPFEVALENLRNIHYDFLYEMKMLLSNKAA